MAIYKCICCGEEVQSNKINTCLHCGHLMFEVPYDRKIKLASQILHYLSKIQNDSVSIHYLSYKDKHKDAVRFPEFRVIKKYITSARKHEDYFDRFRKTIDELTKYLSTEFNNKYEVDYSHLQNKVIFSDNLLKNALKELKYDYFASSIVFPCAIAHYAEHPDKELLFLATCAIEKMRLLIKKIQSFVVFNNLYNEPLNDFTIEMDYQELKKNPAKCLEKHLNKITAVLDKKYEIDIFSDGTEELDEMLQILWEVLFSLCEVKVLIPSYQYELQNGILLSDVDFEKQLHDLIFTKYAKITENFSTDYLLSTYDEESLFTIYANYLMQDVIGAFSVNKKHLLMIGESEKKLNSLVGLSAVKENIKKIKNYINKNKSSQRLNLHMLFNGNPGTGKTEVARIIAGILYENKILPTKNLVETDRSGLIGEYVGETAIKTLRVIQQAMGGVLFIDEAYSLISDNSGIDYGHEALSTLVKAMEDYRGQFCVIFAGYKAEMNEMINANPGFASRIQFMVDFDNYSRDELAEIALLMLQERQYTIKDDALDLILDILDVKRKNRNFANAREVRNILDQVIMCQNLRATDDSTEIGLADVNRYVRDNNIQILSKDNIILTGEEELEQLIGLENVKKVIRKIKAYVQLNKNATMNLHMAFHGNPGTGKTEVARIISRIFYELNVLKEAKLVETDAYGLTGSYVGETDKKVKKIVSQALNGVLFVDEAYALAGNDRIQNSYGTEALTVLLKEMEDNRGSLCVIFAGYKNEMKQMINSNPGLESRIQFNLEFLDYTRGELSEIATGIAKKKHYELSDEALNRIMDITDYERSKPNYANARTVRNILEQVILNQNMRMFASSDKNAVIEIEDVEEYISDRMIDLPKCESSSIKKSSFDGSTLRELYYEFEQDLTLDYLRQCVISLSSSTSQGTAFVISPDGYCLTCAHCISNSSEQKARLSIMMANGKVFHIYVPFSVIRMDTINDLALIQLEKTNEEYCFMPLAGQKYKYVPLNRFIMAGYPFGGETYSNISFTNGTIASENMIEQRKVVFADMFGKPGNSGSPVIDEKTKKVIGVFWGGVQQGPVEMIPCFTPIDIIWEFLSK